MNIPETSVFYNLEVAARRFPAKTAIQFFGASTSYAQLLSDVERIAGYLQQVCGVKRGDRVLVISQNCPQFIAAYFAILRADACFVPVNAMLLEDEVRHIANDSGAVAAFVAEELMPQVVPLLADTPLSHVIVHAYADALGDDDAGLLVPNWLRARSPDAAWPTGVARWQAALDSNRSPGPHLAGPDDLCMLPYTSGTTGAPKACVHTHGTVTSSLVAATLWRRVNAESTFLAVAPLFHLLGLAHVNTAIYAGSTIVLLPRWDREAVAILLERHRVTFWAALPAMLVDFFDQPGIEERDFSCLTMVTGGGAATPQHVAEILQQRYGLDYIEGYGMTETASFLCANPLHKPKQLCLGVPTFGVDLRLVDPLTLAPVRRGRSASSWYTPRRSCLATGIIRRPMPRVSW